MRSFHTNDLCLYHLLTAALVTQLSAWHRQERLEKGMKDVTKRLRGIKMLLTRVRKDVRYIGGPYDTRIAHNKRELSGLKSMLDLLPLHNPNPLLFSAIRGPGMSLS